jgi:hypothetical protein
MPSTTRVVGLTGVNGFMRERRCESAGSAAAPPRAAARLIE